VVERERARARQQEHVYLRSTIWATLLRIKSISRLNLDRHSPTTPSRSPAAGDTCAICSESGACLALESSPGALQGAAGARCCAPKKKSGWCFAECCNTRELQSPDMAAPAKLACVLHVSRCLSRSSPDIFPQLLGQIGFAPIAAVNRDSPPTAALEAIAVANGELYAMAPRGDSLTQPAVALPNVITADHDLPSPRIGEGLRCASTRPCCTNMAVCPRPQACAEAGRAAGMRG